ncbi:MAG: NADP-dependent isocitrate dehydrogenase [Clostridiales Family XIII bacterium]|jgi:isocitrate dehydrogenase|nr:NADP-dependent isocitrate dehydrogenase [Clostridiales Family XIII bacterium]
MEKQEKLKMAAPLVELDGDEMTRILWAWVKEYLIEPFVELKTEYYDLGLEERERTHDEITVRAAEAIKRHGVGVKCATITPNDERVKEYGLTEMYKSPNGTIRAILDGTVFRAPILAKGITPYIPTWRKPITIARHAYGDIYKNTETRVDKGASAALLVGGETLPIFNFKDTGGVVQGVHNTDESITSFARACFAYALSTKQDLWFGAKDTISKIYDRRFRDIFEDVYRAEYQDAFREAGLEYFYSLIDDVIARVIRSEGGFIWACKNYDGDVMSDMVATAYGSLAMMTSVLVSPHGWTEYEAAHGTVQRHYYKHKKGEPTSTNSVATIFAWSGALKKRAELDALPRLAAFAEAMELATLKTIEDGLMTGDLYAISRLEHKQQVSSETFLLEAAQRLSAIGY